MALDADAPGRLVRVAVRLWTAAALLCLAVIGTTAGLVAMQYRESIEEGREATLNLATRTAAATNHMLLAIDLPLAGVAESIGEGDRTPDGRKAPNGPPGGAEGGAAALDPEPLRKQFQLVTRRNLLIRSLGLLGAEGQTLLTIGASGPEPALTPPPEFVRAVLAQSLPALAVSLPSTPPGVYEPMLYFGRPVARHGRVIGAVVAAIPVAQVAAAVQLDDDRPGTEAALQRADGVILMGVPASDPTDPKAAHSHASSASPPDRADEALAPLSGLPALVAVRPVLHPGLHVVAASTLQVTLRHWVRYAWTAGLGTLGLVAALLAAAAFAQRQLRRMALARTEQARSKALLEQALQSMHDGLLLTDADDRVVLWNERYLDLFPWLRGVIAVGLPFRVLAETAAAALLPDAAPEARETWVQQRQAARLRDRMMHTRTGSDERVVHTVERRTPDGGVVSVYRDSTAIERELARLKEAAEAASDAKTRFLAAMSHEIRTPLNAVLGMNGLLLASPLNAEQRRQAELIRSSGQSLLAIINDILDLSKIEAGRMELEIVDFPLADTVSDVVSLLEVRAQAKGLALALEMAPDLPTHARGDPSRLRQVLFNLVGNALKFTHAGQVKVSLRSRPLQGRKVELTLVVSDTGVGIPAESLPRLFEPFSQAESSTARRYGGTGLGLAISRQIVELMGGRIEAHSQPGQGSTFTAVMVVEAGAPLPGPGRGGAKPTAPPPSRVARRILVAEDNAVNQILIKAMLDRLGHYSDIVADGLEALNQVQAAHYDLVLMDIQMPVMDGATATRRIRALPGAVSRVPIIAMTANAMPEDRDAYVAAGVNGYVSKPIDLDLLAAAIDRAAMSRPGS